MTRPSLSRSSPLTPLRSPRGHSALGWTAAAVVSLAGLIGLPGLARAQDGTPQTLAEARQALEQNKAGLTGDANAIKKARNAILAPLSPALSVADRQDYATAVVSAIRPLAGDTHDQVAINTVRIAGELATKDAMDILAAGLKDKRAALRMTAALGYARTFRIVRETQPAILALQASAAIGMLRETLAGESDPQVIEGAIIALDAASKVPAAKLDIRTQALDAMVAGVSDVAQHAAVANGPTAVSVSPGLSRAAQSLFEVFSTPTGAPSDDLAKAAAGYVGDVVAMADREVTSNPAIDTAERARLAFLTGQALRIFDAASAKIHGPALDLKLDALLTQSKDDEFKAEAAKLIGDDGVLTKAPFSVKATRFAIN